LATDVASERDTPVFRAMRFESQSPCQLHRKRESQRDVNG